MDTRVATHVSITGLVLSALAFAFAFSGFGFGFGSGFGMTLESLAC